MNRLMLVIILGIVAAFSVSAAEIDQEERASIRGVDRIEIREKTFTGIGVAINSIRTSVNVLPEGRDDVVVNLRGEATTNRRSDNLQFEMEKSGKTLRITLDKGQGVRFLVIRKGELTLDVRIPKDYREKLSVEVSSARVNIGSFELAELYAHTSSGNLTVDEIKADAIDIEASSGDVDLSTAQAKTLFVHTSSGKINAGTLSAEKLEITASSGDIRIESLAGNGSVRTSSGSIRAAESRGVLDFKASSGDVRLLGAEGSCKVNSSSGDVEVDFNGNTGQVNVESSSGKITVKELDGSAVLDSTSGNIEAEFTGFLDDSKLEASSGEIDVELPRDASFMLDARTASGRIQVDFPITVTGEIKKDRISGSVGTAGPSLEIKTSSGDISIRSR